MKNRNQMLLNKMFKYENNKTTSFYNAEDNGSLVQG